MDDKMILAGDVGGTKTRLAFCKLENGRITRQQTDTFVSREYSCLENVVQDFINKYDVSVTRSCFGVPGPVVNGEAKATKLPWHFKEEQISNELNIPTVKLVNDLVATAAAIPHLMPEDLYVLHESELPGSTAEGQSQSRNSGSGNGEDVIGVLAPGTGLGQAYVYAN
ncbi:MAG: glucokinase, partial [Candidatus Brocadiales bacterium]|nr:glucokinase [Candidatus Brocadiales bacterium]